MSSLLKLSLFFLSLNWHVFEGFLPLTQAFLHIMSLGFCIIRVFRAEIEKHPVQTGWTSESVAGSRDWHSIGRRAREQRGPPRSALLSAFL